MNGLIQAIELWLPDAEASLLEFGAGLYGGAGEMQTVSRTMCFGRAEGLPGLAWDEGRPVLLSDLQTGLFRRAAAARRAGLTSAVALPYFDGPAVRAVLVLFCGGDTREDGAVELWRNDPRLTGDMTLLDGHYGSTARALLADAREAYLPRGSGLPGLAWQRQGSVFMTGLSGSSRFLRSEAAAAAGLLHGLALPCPVPGHEHFVLTLFSTPASPIARRIDCWAPGARGSAPTRLHGHDEAAGELPGGAPLAADDPAAAALARAFASGLPQLQPAVAGDRPNDLAVLPVSLDGSVTEAVVLRF